MDQCTPEMAEQLEVIGKLRRVLDGYLTLYTMLTNMIEQFDGEIEELAEESSHSEDIRHLVCLRGIKNTRPWQSFRKSEISIDSGKGTYLPLIWDWHRESIPVQRISIVRAFPKQVIHISGNFS